MGQKLVSPATYWRRRVVVLAAGVAVIGLPIWAVNQALGGGPAPGRGSPRSHADHATGAGAHPSATRGPRQALTGDTAHLGARPQAQPSVSSPGTGAAATHRSGRRACAVLTLRSAQHLYGPRELVTFVVGAVSTRNRPCRVNLGSRFTSVVVASGGTPIWDSSSCPRGAGSQMILLRRGTPASLRVTWDRRTSLSGCPGQGTAVRAGTYTVAAFDGQLRSQPTTFVLTGRGAAVP